MRFAMGRVNRLVRFCPGARRFARVELKASVTKHVTTSRAFGDETASEGQTVIESKAVRVSMFDFLEYLIFW